MIVSCMQSILVKLGLKVLDFECVRVTFVAFIRKISSGGVSGKFSLKIFYDAIKILFISKTRREDSFLLKSCRARAFSK
jgi:hypothetical protein